MIGGNYRIDLAFLIDSVYVLLVSSAHYSLESRVPNHSVRPELEELRLMK